MSLDLTLSKTCFHCNHEKVIYEGNYTYNVSKMWYYMFPEHKQFIPIDDMTGYKAVPIIRKALTLMVKNKDDLISFIKKPQTVSRMKKTVFCILI